MKISKIFAGMSALAMSAAMFSAVAVSADDAPQENGFYPATYTAEYSYSGSDIASLCGSAVIDPVAGDSRLEGLGAQLVGYTNKETGEVDTYNLGFNIQVGHVKNALITIEVTSSSGNIYDGSGGTDSGYMYTVQKSWNQDCPADDEAGEVPFQFNDDGSPKTMKGATYLNEWDSGPTKYNGQWAQITLTDDDVSALTFNVKFEATDSSKWEYHPYDPDSTEETPNQYQVFCFAGGDSQAFPFELVDCDTINEQFGGVTSKNYNAGGDSSNAESKADESKADTSSANGGSGDSTSKADTSSAAADSSSASDTSSAADTVDAGSTDTANAGNSDSSSSSTAAASASSSSSTAAASADSKSSTSSTAASATKSSTTTTTSSSAAAPAGGGSDGSAESDATSNAASGAAAGVGLAITAVAAAAIVVSKRRD